MMEKSNHQKEDGDYDTITLPVKFKRVIPKICPFVNVYTGERGVGWV